MKTIDTIMIAVLHCMVIACFYGCGRKGDTSAAVYTPVVSTDGKTVSIRAADEQYKIIYRSTEDILQQEGITRKDTSVYNKRRADLNKGLWFHIKLSAATSGESLLRYKDKSVAEYKQRLDYYTNRASSDIMLVCGADTLYPVSYWFENNYNMSPDDVIIVAFDRPAPVPASGMTLIYYDRIFKNGLLKANFNKNIQL